MYIGMVVYKKQLYLYIEYIIFLTVVLAVHSDVFCFVIEFEPLFYLLYVFFLLLLFLIWIHFTSLYFLLK